MYINLGSDFETFDHVVCQIICGFIVCHKKIHQRPPSSCKLFHSNYYMHSIILSVFSYLVITKSQTQ